jgi:hypothetical protein
MVPTMARRNMSRAAGDAAVGRTSSLAYGLDSTGSSQRFNSGDRSSIKSRQEPGVQLIGNARTTSGLLESEARYRVYLPRCRAARHGHECAAHHSRRLSW